MENFFKSKKEHKNDAFSAMKKQIKAITDQNTQALENLTQVGGGPQQYQYLCDKLH